MCAGTLWASHPDFFLTGRPRDLASGVHTRSEVADRLPAHDGARRQARSRQRRAPSAPALAAQDAAGPLPPSSTPPASPRLVRGEKALPGARCCSELRAPWARSASAPLCGTTLAPRTAPSRRTGWRGPHGCPGWGGGWGEALGGCVSLRQRPTEGFLALGEAAAEWASSGVLPHAAEAFAPCAVLLGVRTASLITAPSVACGATALPPTCSAVALAAAFHPLPRPPRPAPQPRLGQALPSLGAPRRVPPSCPLCVTGRPRAVLR